MRQCLIAFPVKGDAFFLQRGQLSVLVDSGGSGRQLANLLKKHAPDIERIKIAVCTHADQDHAGGFTSLLDHWSPCRASKAPIDQFWLPGAWVDVVPDLLTNTKKLADSLVKELEEIASKFLEINEEDAIVDTIDNTDSQWDREQKRPKQEKHESDEKGAEGSEEKKEPLDNFKNFKEPEWMKDLREQKEQILRDAPVAERALQSARRRVRYRRDRDYVSRGLAAYWLSLIDTADRIRKIALSAIKYHVKVRWFDYGEFINRQGAASGGVREGAASGGVRDFLIPVNAVEQSSPPTTDLAYYQILRLSVKNEQCLAFYAPGEQSLSPSVLFCGDSPMGSGAGYVARFPLPSRSHDWPLFATAPHHGADSNAMAYSYVDSWAGKKNTIWLRSGGTNNHPESTFRSQIPAGQRFCTHCPHLHLPRVPIEVTFDPFGLRCPFHIIIFSGHRCTC